MNARDYQIDDIYRVEELHNRNCKFPFPDLGNKLYFARGIIEDKNEIIACGLIKYTSEVVLILDHSRSISEQLECIHLLFEKGIEQTLNVGIPDWHFFIQEK